MLQPEQVLLAVLFFTPRYQVLQQHACVVRTLSPFPTPSPWSLQSIALFVATVDVKMSIMGLDAACLLQDEAVEVRGSPLPRKQIVWFEGRGGDPFSSV